MGFPEDGVSGSSLDSVLPQFKLLPGVALPNHQFVIGVLLQEWKDPGCIALPRFMSKLYPLEDMDLKLPESVHVDLVVASLVCRSSMAEENILKDGAGKKVDSSVKKAYAGAQLAL
ncbi:hypothetical protein NDU88_002823 [Pleurodeles waltl]|uniref:Uncharacterized protein n=1 Tax=Pleurodeles waltl TaxID=8319 RepID=A0AAV7SEL9_PLEWA|nr:hypothetical protein NDU88_002823 [Pleurodeles waltl]